MSPHPSTRFAVAMKIGLAILMGMALSTALGAADSRAQTDEQRKLGDAAAVLQYFSSSDQQSIPIELLERARGIAVFPDVIRGGFIVGARRGRGVLVVRTEDGEWSNPAVVTLTGGSIGWQVGAEAADVVLVFANDNAVKNIRSGKFTLGGDASAVAGPLGRHATMAVTFRAEVYGYVRSRGLFAGAAFEGTRLAIDEEASRRLYDGPGDAALGPQSSATPPAARRFLLTLAEAEIERGPAPPSAAPGAAEDETPEQEAQTFPLENAR